MSRVSSTDNGSGQLTRQYGDTSDVTVNMFVDDDDDDDDDNDDDDDKYDNDDGDNEEDDNDEGTFAVDTCFIRIHLLSDILKMFHTGCSKEHSNLILGHLKKNRCWSHIGLGLQSSLSSPGLDVASFASIYPPIKCEFI